MFQVESPLIEIRECCLLGSASLQLPLGRTWRALPHGSITLTTILLRKSSAQLRACQANQYLFVNKSHFLVIRQRAFTARRGCRENQLGGLQNEFRTLLKVHSYLCGPVCRRKKKHNQTKYFALDQLNMTKILHPCINQIVSTSY